MPYPPDVTFVGSTTARWTGYTSSVDVPPGTQPGDLLVAIFNGSTIPAAMDSLDQILSPGWFSGQRLALHHLTSASRLFQSGDPTTFPIDITPTASVSGHTYDIDGPGGNCVLLAFRGPKGGTGAVYHNYVAMDPQGLPGSRPYPSPKQIGALAQQTFVPYPGFDPNATLSLAMPGFYEGIPPMPVVIVAYSAFSSATWITSLEPGVTHHSHKYQSGTWTTPVDEAGFLTFTEVADLGPPHGMMVAYALNGPPHLEGPLGQVSSIVSSFTSGNYPPEVLDGREFGGFLAAMIHCLSFDSPPEITETPWLRQRQRDDPVRVAGSAKNGPKSKQRSIRRGWRNTYL